MKKMKVVFPVLFLVCAGMFMMSCTSDPDPGRTIEEGEGVITLKSGKYQYVFATPRIEHGKVYEVTFTVEEADEYFYGKHIGGKICYKMNLSDPDDKLLSGWQNATPDTLSESTKAYKWTFKAGEKYSDGLTPEKDATTPEGGIQYFSITVQTTDWKDSKEDFKVKGGFEVREAEIITEWESAGTLTLGNVESIAGKGELSAADVAKIRDMPANSIIKFSVNVTVNTSDAQAGYGVGGIGSSWSGGISINIPGDAPLGPLDFEKDIKISDLLGIIGTSNTIIINLYNGATITKAELFKPKS